MSYRSTGSTRKTEAWCIRQSHTPHSLMNQNPTGCGTQECLSALRVSHPPTHLVEQNYDLYRSDPAGDQTIDGPRRKLRAGSFELTVAQDLLYS